MIDVGEPQFPGRGPGPQFKYRPPWRGLGFLERPRLHEALAAAADSRRVTLVSAPAGYGKSTVLADWVRDSEPACAWLSLDRFDTEAARLFHGVVRALQAAAGKRPLPGNNALLALDQRLARDRVASYDHLLGALELLTEPLVLVIDDVHLAGPGLADGIVGVLAASAPPPLRLVLSGRGHPSIQLERLRHGDGLGGFGAAELAFTVEEVSRFAHSLGQDADVDAGPLWTLTSGWPVAVHASLNALAQDRNKASPDTLPVQLPLADYIDEEILGQLEPPLADFVLRATTCDVLDRRLAVELHGRTDGGMLLEACLRSGLFISERELRGNESVYRWHPLFAAQCRRILERRDPLLSQRLHRVAARYYQDTDVWESVAQALRGRAPGLAATSIGEHWLELLLRNGAHSLEQVCRDLPAPWCEDPEVLLIRSVCRALDGDNAAASSLTRRALGRTAALDAARRRRFHQCRTLFDPAPDGARLERGTSPANFPGESAGAAMDCFPATSSGLFLLARAEFRLYRMGDHAAALLQSAAGAGNPKRLAALDVYFQAEVASALAAGGDIVAADEQATQAVEAAARLGCGSQDRMAAAWLARGMAFYWRDELKGARAHLAQAERLGGKLFPAGPLSVVFRVLVDSAAGDPSHLAESGAALEWFHDRGRYGASWEALHTIARAKIAEANGDAEGALGIARLLGSGGHSPLVDTLLAELLRRVRDVGAAQRCAAAVTGRDLNPCLDISVSLTEALLAHGTGDEATAHERLEHAVSRAEPQAILRPFTERQDDLAELLNRHAVWGTTHERFVAARMASRPAGHPRLRTRSYLTLTDREREVLSYMRSVLTAAEIAEALYISVNTVKTHERSIYRKLGAAGRRAAVKAAAERGII